MALLFLATQGQIKHLLGHMEVLLLDDSKKGLGTWMFVQNVIRTQDT